VIRALSVSILVVTLLSTPIALGTVAAVGTGSPGSAGDASTVAVGSPSSPVVEPSSSVTVTRSGPETVEYGITMTNVSGADELWVVVDGATVVSASGLDRTDTGDRTRLRWTGAGTVRVVLSTPVDAGESGQTDAAAGWSFGELPLVEVQWRVDGSVSRTWPLTAPHRPLPGDQSLTGDRYALVGDHKVATRTTSGQRIRLAVPGTADIDSAAVFDALAGAARDLDVGDRDDAVLAFAVPSRTGGAAVPARDEFWVDADAALESPENVWIHEYVHTRQSFSLAADMRWFREASAEYYAARLSYEQSAIDRTAMRRSLDGEPSRATLADPATWGSEQVPREKGARTLAVLDRKIRSATFGHRSLQDVFRRLNGHDGRVTYAVFAQAVAEVTGQPMDAWLDRHIAGNEPVADQYGPSVLAVAGLPTLDRLGALSGEGFLLLAIAFSALAVAPLYGVLEWIERRSREQPPGSSRSDRRPVG